MNIIHNKGCTKYITYWKDEKWKPSYSNKWNKEYIMFPKINWIWLSDIMFSLDVNDPEFWIKQTIKNLNLISISHDEYLEKKKIWKHFTLEKTIEWWERRVDLYFWWWSEWYSAESFKDITIIYDNFDEEKVEYYSTPEVIKVLEEREKYLEKWNNPKEKEKMIEEYEREKEKLRK